MCVLQKHGGSVESLLPFELTAQQKGALAERPDKNRLWSNPERPDNNRLLSNSEKDLSESGFSSLKSGAPKHFHLGTQKKISVFTWIPSAHSETE